jgi:hypothetical protein
VKRGIALTVLALAVTAGGCGESSPGQLESQQPATTARFRPGKGPGCDARGINDTYLREGRCIEEGVRYVVANGRSTMQLRTLRAAIRGISIAQEIPTGRGPAARPQGIFVLVRMAVENRDHVPRRFGPGQTTLGIAGQQYPEIATVERRSYRDAFAFTGRRPIPPGASDTGHVVFDVPPDQVERIETEGRLIVVDFDAPSLLEGGSPREVGQFRLYHGA